MDYQQFEKKVLEGVQQRYSGCEVSVRSVYKNNNIKFRGLYIREPEVMISPTIYLEDYFCGMKNDSDIEDIISEICRVYEHHKCTELADVILFSIRDLVTATDRIYYTVINKDRNSELLSEIPHREILDLAVVCRMSINMGDSISGSALVNNNMIDSWGITEDELFSMASKNTPVMLGCEMKNMLELLFEIYRRQDNYKLISLLANQEPYMYVVSNREKSYGAGVIFLNDDFREEVRRKLRSDFVVIPSSIHETIVIPYTEELNRNTLISLVNEVNRTEVQSTEVLSDNIYLCDENGIRIWS